MRLTEEELNWIAEISASVLRTKQLRKTPKDRRKLPEWWRSHASELPSLNTPVPEELTYDLKVAVAALTAIVGARPASVGT